MYEIIATGDKELDFQHSQLIEWMNDLEGAIQRQESSDKLVPLIYRLQFYAHTHFAYEEGGMKFLNYPETVQHIEDHSFFSSWLKDLKDIIERDPSFSSEVVLSFLKKWLINHIGKADVHYASYVAEMKLR